MSFIKGLRITRSKDGCVEVSHKDLPGWATRRCAAPTFWGSARVTAEARKAELDRLEKLATEALRNLYDHKFKPRKK